MSTRRRWLAPSLALALALVCAACAGNPLASNPFASTPPAPPVDPKTQMAALESRIFDLVQDARRKINPDAKALALDSELLGVARQRSADMADKNYFAHASPQGETSASLIMDKDVDFQGLLGENLAAQHFTKGYAIDVDIFAHRFVDSWLSSPEHRDNLAFAAYDRSGVGAAVNGDTIYVTQLFATNLGLPPHPHDPKQRRVSQWPSAKAAAAPTPPSAPVALRGAQGGDLP